MIFIQPAIVVFIDTTRDIRGIQSTCHTGQLVTWPTCHKVNSSQSNRHIFEIDYKSTRCIFRMDQKSTRHNTFQVKQTYRSVNRVYLRADHRSYEMVGIDQSGVADHFDQS